MVAVPGLETRVWRCVELRVRVTVGDTAQSEMEIVAGVEWPLLLKKSRAQWVMAEWPGWRKAWWTWALG